MTSKLFLFPTLLALLCVTLTFSQDGDEAFADDLREHFDVLGEELNEQLEGMLEEVRNLTEELGHAKQEGDESGIEHLSIDLNRIQGEVAAWQALLAQYRKMMALEGESFLDAEGHFNRTVEKAHWQRDLDEANAEIGHIEADLRFLEREEGSEEIEDDLKRRLNQAREIVQSRLRIMDDWEKIDAAWSEGREEEAEELESGLWLRERDLSFRIDEAEIKSRAVEAAARMKDLRKEMIAAGDEAHLAKKLLKHHAQAVQGWERIKRNLENADEEEREELLEQLHHLDDKFHLQREIMEVRLLIARANAFGETDEIEELTSHLQEMEQEALEQEDR